MPSVATVTLIGHLGRDPETRYTPQGTMNCSFTMATSRRWTDRDGITQERATWFRITAWGKLAEIMDTLTQKGSLRKGQLVYVQGGLESREYTDPQGEKRVSLDVNANEIQLLGSREAQDTPHVGAPGDEVPF